MLTLDHITKSFGPTLAVDDVSLRVGRGEIVAVVGENGAGKTTVMRIVAGETAPDRGAVTLDGRAALVHQHFMLVSNFTIAENLALSATATSPLSRRGNSSTGGVPHTTRRRSFFSRRSLNIAAESIIAASGLDLGDVSRCVADLSVGERSKLELIKAIATRPDLLILDEPTSVLTPSETEELFEVIRRLAASGTAILFISHKLREVVAIAQRIVVMRAGRVVAETAAHDMTVEAVAQAMIGERTAISRDYADAAIGRTDVVTGQERSAPSRRGVPARRAAIDALACQQVFSERLDDVTFAVGSGEIAAILGVSGNGQSELAAVLRGLVAPRSGTVTLDGRRISRAELARSRQVGHIPEDRTRDGLVGQMSIAENIALTASRWQPAQARRLAERIIALYSIRAESALQPAATLSGGNQQKVILARELDRRPACIVAAEPTRGLDIAATAFVHEQLRAAARAGSGILLITSDLDEAFTLADAIYVIYRGRLSERLTPADASRRIANLMAGVA